MDNLRIITTADGSHSLFNTTLNETYHSQHGALQESNHVFIKNGLDFYREQTNASTIRIFEVGFGTGLNAWLSLQYADPGKTKILYTAVETLPIQQGVWSDLNYAQSANEKGLFDKIHSCEWNVITRLTDCFQLLKVETSVQDFRALSEYEIIFFDAFAPSKQPEMWEYTILEKVCDSLSAGGVFVTYCAKGQVKRDLKTLGLKVETLAGPPGKKEMIRAIKG